MNSSFGLQDPRSDFLFLPGHVSDVSHLSPSMFHYRHFLCYQSLLKDHDYNRLPKNLDPTLIMYNLTYDPDISLGGSNGSWKSFWDKVSNGRPRCNFISPSPGKMVTKRRVKKTFPVRFVSTSFLVFAQLFILWPRSPMVLFFSQGTLNLRTINTRSTNTVPRDCSRDLSHKTTFPSVLSRISRWVSILNNVNFLYFVLVVSFSLSSVSGFLCFEGSLERVTLVCLT